MTCGFNLWMSTTSSTKICLFLKTNLEVKDILETFSPTYGHFAVPGPQHAELMSKGLVMAQLHNQLSVFFEHQDDPLFNLTTKVHMALHSFQYSKYLHPFLSWTFKGESTMHRLQLVWKSCLSGSKHWQAAKKAAWKERHLLWIEGKV